MKYLFSFLINVISQIFQCIPVKFLLNYDKKLFTHMHCAISSIIWILYEIRLKELVTLFEFEIEVIIQVSK